VEWLAERGGRVFGVDASAEMLAVARAKAPRAGLKLATAEALPFRDGWFDRVVFQLSVHLLDRPLAFAEARRVLVLGGRVAIMTFEQEHFERFYLNAFFPSLAEIDRARFPTRDQLATDLEEAGFATPVFESFAQHVRTPRGDVLERIRARHISTLELLPPEEHASGLARAERELPELVESSRLWLFASAPRPRGDPRPASG
jgi:ubiquinone/menaquinone biosynthesis C-methylase UbiE